MHRLLDGYVARFPQGEREVTERFVIQEAQYSKLAELCKKHRIYCRDIRQAFRRGPFTVVSLLDISNTKDLQPIYAKADRYAFEPHGYGYKTAENAMRSARKLGACDARALLPWIDRPDIPGFDF